MRQAMKAMLLLGLRGGAIKLGTDCYSHLCSDGYVPKSDHHALTGNNDEKCCQKTCKLWVCKGDYVENPKYFGNIDPSDLKCCDKTCSAITSCPAGMAVPANMKDIASLNESECCENTCENVECEAHFVKRQGVEGSIPEKGKGNEVCCQPTCGMHTCDASKGLRPYTAHMDETEPNDLKCCQATCRSFQCPQDYELDPSKLDDVTHGMECCSMLCYAHKCTDGMVTDPVKALVHGMTNEECCQKTCESFTCRDGWIANPQTKSFVQPTNETCCTKTCALYQEQCTGSWAPDESKHQIVASNSESCCKATCARHECTTGILIPEDAATSLVADTDDECCEDRRCPALRKKSHVKQCNGLTEDECSSNFVILNNTKTGTTDILDCRFDAMIGVCKLGDLEPTNCYSANVAARSANSTAPTP
eukprot:TRINITY_DN8018_c0_g1_i3.p1 TRINITY_DN8018_c0_g1~~TRINITY_DN8018_c0_g1_i3.p1  ORF type:complete len:420 (-),score=55.38 TRINITY_DN8018_c0_g1_i3:147-1406(-)